MNTIPTPRRLAHWACALALAAGYAQAETPEPAALAPPFDTYQRWRDAPVADWREANERVHAAGGWRVYLRETQGGAAGDDPHAHHHHP